MIVLQLIYKIICISRLQIGRYIYTVIFKIILRINGVRYGKGLRTYNAIPSLIINRKANTVLFGDNILFNNYTDQSWYSKCKVCVQKGASLIIGDNSGMNGVLIYCENYIKIGSYVNIGGGTRISDSNHHNLNWKSRRDPKKNNIAKTAPIIIENDVFIGANCYIGKGVTIGSRSIIAAGSVIVKNIPSDEIWGGNPAKKIRDISEYEDII